MGARALAVRRRVVEAVGEGLEATRRAVAEVGQPDALSELVGELAQGTAEAAVCARGSFRHVLGFDKLVLVDAGSRQSLRVHVWHGAGGSGAREDVHNHRSALASCVVRGRLGMELYDVAEVPAAPGSAAPGPGTGVRAEIPGDVDVGADCGLAVFAYRETHAQRHGDWRLVPRGPARVRLIHTGRYAAGASYALPARTLHRAWCDSAEPTVTLYLEGGGERREHTDVFSASPVHPPAVRKGSLTVEEYLAALAALSEVLRGRATAAGATAAAAGEVPGPRE